MTAGQDDLPVFDNPPVIETVLGVQFAPIPGFTSGHYGWYWKNVLDDSWVRALEAPPLTDQFETFGELSGWRLPLIQLSAGGMPGRLQFINAQDDRVIQIQNTRFIYNWRKRESSYPSFRKTYPEFTDKLGGFRGFLQTAELCDIAPNQWEVSYFNHVPKGELWETPDDWSNVFPSLFPTPRRSDLVRFESLSAEWHSEIPPERGRLHIAVQHGRPPEGTPDVLSLHLTARGLVRPDDRDWGLDSGLELGHRVLARMFASLASEAALKHWGIG
jgi:uncharacterized protein (TIGR04255 family)